MTESGKEMPIEISIIIPCRNEGRTICLLLNAIKEQGYPNEKMEIVIADGLSEDDTRQQIATFSQENPDMRLKVINNPKLTIPSALNTAIRSSQAKIILRMDAHSIPAKDYVERCVAALDEDLGENVGGVWDIRPQIDSLTAKAIAAAAAHPLAGGLYRHTKKAAYVDSVPFGAFKRDLLDKIGMFDESLLSNEDYEFNTRIRLKGGRVWIDPEIRSVYFSRKNLEELGKQYWRYGYWKAQMLKRYPNTLKLRQAIPPIFVAGLILLAILAVFLRIFRVLLLFILGVYLLALLVVGIQIALKEKVMSHIFFVPAAMITMHFCWGAGFNWGFLFPRATKGS